MHLKNIIGLESDVEFVERLHLLEHKGLLDVIELKREDASRRRMRLKSNLGNEYLLSLPRDEYLQNGSILYLTNRFGVVVRLEGGPRLKLEPFDISSALRLGYHCGNLHWKTKFKDGSLEIPIDSPESEYVKRLKPLEEYAKFKISVIEK
tara:strand:+ start:164 stop:613 length:450 start_codon:yes stop_codon:yes gene_type:complete